MKTVVFNSPYLIHVEFPDARIDLHRGVPTQVTDEQAAILLTNPDVTVVESASPPAPQPTTPFVSIESTKALDSSPVTAKFQSDKSVTEVE